MSGLLNTAMLTDWSDWKVVKTKPISRGNFLFVQPTQPGADNRRNDLSECCLASLTCQKVPLTECDWLGHTAVSQKSQTTRQKAAVLQAVVDVLQEDAR